jgi:hypothetical protein
MLRPKDRRCAFINNKIMENYFTQFNGFNKAVKVAVLFLN